MRFYFDCIYGKSHDGKKNCLTFSYIFFIFIFLWKIINGWKSQCRKIKKQKKKTSAERTKKQFTQTKFNIFLLFFRYLCCKCIRHQVWLCVSVCSTPQTKNLELNVKSIWIRFIFTVCGCYYIKKNELLWERLMRLFYIWEKFKP